LLEGLSVYRVDATKLKALRPDIIVTQDHCAAATSSRTVGPRSTAQTHRTRSLTAASTIRLTDDALLAVSLSPLWAVPEWTDGDTASIIPIVGTIRIVSPPAITIVGSVIPIVVIGVAVTPSMPVTISVVVIFFDRHRIRVVL
jgi:hypothetical protein